MNQEEIKKFLESFQSRQDRTIVIVDYGNVEKWKNSLGWKVGIKQLGNLVKHFSSGKQFLRRFYYGSDYGKNERSTLRSEWSRSATDRAKMNRFEVVTKRVKCMHSQSSKYGFEKKCDLDVEMTVDLIKERDNYDTIIIFSGDGDLMYAIRYLRDMYDKKCIVFGARGHIGREVFDAKVEGFVNNILFADDFEYRLNDARFRC
ncbi:NYN domain-containing protein [Candidatus Uhrbacteria bacterium]|nr:NYN domain-containing protein [Candidatus Uhrbacteria bacterium]